MTDASRFEFIAGSLSLAFVDTKGGRDGAGIERLTDTHTLAEWIGAAGLAAGEAVQPDRKQLEQAHALREAIYRAACAVMAARAPADEDVAQINAAALEPPLRPQITMSGVRNVAPSPISAALSTIAGDAIETLGQGARIRECSECRMLFLDTSRPGRRRWCSSSAGCGNRAKVRNHRARRAAINPAGD